jgi:hypothetical protein
MTRVLMILTAAWFAVVLGHTGLTTSLAISELTARAAELARW